MFRSAKGTDSFALTTERSMRSEGESDTPSRLQQQLLVNGNTISKSKQEFKLDQGAHRYLNVSLFMWYVGRDVHTVLMGSMGMVLEEGRCLASSSHAKTKNEQGVDTPTPRPTIEKTKTYTLTPAVKLTTSEVVRVMHAKPDTAPRTMKQNTTRNMKCRTRPCQNFETPSEPSASLLLSGTESLLKIRHASARDFARP